MGAEHELLHDDHEHHEHHDSHNHEEDHGHDDHGGHGHGHSHNVAGHGHSHGGPVMGAASVHVGHKTAALCIMALATLIFSLAPIYVRKKIIKKSANSNKREIILSGLLCLGAGVLLATVFLHLLPETRHKIDDAMDQGHIPKTEFPLAEVLLCCGFFLIYLIEDLVHKCVGHSHHKEEVVAVSPVSIRSVSTVEGGMYSNNNGTLPEKVIPNGIDNKGFQGDLDHHDSTQAPAAPENDATSQPALMKGEETSVLHAVIVIVAISFHSVMEGLAIGLEDSVTDMWLLMGVLLIHKLIIAFSIGMELLQEGVKLLPFLVAMIIFSLASPIGGIIGSVALAMEDQTVPTILEGLAGGSILFIIFCEILERERARQNGSMIRIAALMVGFGVMCGLESLPGHTH